ncbi:hypothetical protein [Eggerthella sinensis]|uniref:hypothetical protein n=1 Tax=Eggerthella sinensis TaxID=242230 RepID=UPI0022DEF8A4|nr:hypothetical protein [Eggerthella sinensis]
MATGFAAAVVVAAAAVAVAAASPPSAFSAFSASAAFLAARSLSYFALRSEKLSVFSSLSSLPISPTFDSASSGFLNGSSDVGS